MSIDIFVNAYHRGAVLRFPVDVIVEAFAGHLDGDPIEDAPDGPWCARYLDVEPGSPDEPPACGVAPGPRKSGRS